MIQYINKLINNISLTTEEAMDAMDQILDGGATPAQISAFLIAMRMKGEAIDEITGCALKMREKACHIHPKTSDYIDCVGTGGDNTNTFNISTTSAFVIAGAGVPIAKHGNRAISSKSGSADLLEALGVNIMMSPEEVETCIDEIGIGFMFARVFNQSMKTVSGVRADLKTRTIFNILGPISNPSNAKYQVIGVFHKDLVNPLATAMMKMGIERGMVVSGADDGMDELSTTGITYVSEIKNGAVIDYVISPEMFGLKKAAPSQIKGADALKNAQTALSILSGEPGPKRDIVLLNAAAAIYISGYAASLMEGIQLAANSIDEGAAMQKLTNLITFSTSLQKSSI